MEELKTYKKSPSFGLLLLFLYAGCAPEDPGQNYIKECVLPEDQVGTLTGSWRVTPIQIAFHQGSGFSADEIAAGVRAADTWNKFFAASLGMAGIDYGEAGSPRTAPDAKPAVKCAKNLVSGGKFSGSVVIYKQARWPYTEASEAIALTTTCTTSAQPLPFMTMAYIELNYQNYFNGKEMPDLQTILVHEFGHLAGLGHSCEKTSERGVPNCNNSNLAPAYIEAAMYPVFGFDSLGIGEKKRNLMQNDQGRANCLYQGMSPQ